MPSAAQSEAVSETRAGAGAGAGAEATDATGATDATDSARIAADAAEAQQARASARLGPPLLANRLAHSRLHPLRTCELVKPVLPSGRKGVALFEASLSASLFQAETEAAPAEPEPPTVFWGSEEHDE
eukprot:4982639-Pleurochrysis_carterae.AAC.1